MRCIRDHSHNTNLKAFGSYGRSVLKRRIWFSGTGLKSQYWFLSGLGVNFFGLSGLSVAHGVIGFESAVPDELMAKQNANKMTSSAGHENE